MLETDFLKKALELARRGEGQTAPNPAVGAVLVKEGQVIATGYHHYAGGPHAEREALAAMNDASGCDLYVTLEPCCHQGKTPPCTDLIINKQIRRVYFSERDPNPLVAGKGQAALQQAGIFCEQRELPEITEFYQGYRYWQQTKKSFVVLKIAMSLNGITALQRPQRLMLTSEASHYFTHQQRKISHAILTSVKTVLKDDPQLNTRLVDETIKKPVFVIDRDLDFPVSAKLMKTAERITLLHQQAVDQRKLQALLAAGIVCVAIDATTAGLDLAKVLEYISQLGLHVLWVEVGARLARQLLQQQLVNKCYLYIAPKVINEAGDNLFDSQYDLFQGANQLQWRLYPPDICCEIDYRVEGKR